MTTAWLQRSLTLAARPRGFHLITAEIEKAAPDLRLLKRGMAQVFIQHTTASLTLNEDIDRTVRDDFRAWFDDAVPEDRSDWTHTEEGPADMPAHIKASLLDSSVTVPVGDGRMLLGRYQGIYLCEHVDMQRPRRLILSAWGQLERSAHGRGSRVAAPGAEQRRLA